MVTKYKWEIVLYGKWGDSTQTLIVHAETWQQAKEIIYNNYSYIRESSFKSIREIEY